MSLLQVPVVRVLQIWPLRLVQAWEGLMLAGPVRPIVSLPSRL